MSETASIQAKLRRVHDTPDVVERMKRRLTTLPIAYLATTEAKWDIEKIIELYEELDGYEQAT